MTSLVDRCVELVKEKGIRVVIFDLDQTAIVAHSRGRLRRGKPLLDFLSKASSDFLKLVPVLYENNIGLAIATHSDEAEYGIFIKPETHILGDELARTMLEHHFDEDVTKAFFIVAFNPRPRQVKDEKDLLKRYHMRLIQEKFRVQPQDILFFDDDKNNVHDCIEYCRVKSILVDKRVGFQLSDLLENL